MYFRDINESFERAKIKVVVKGVYAERGIGIAQVGKRVTGLVAVLAITRIAVEVQNGHRFRLAGHGKLLGDEVIVYLKKRILLLEPFYLGVVASELSFGKRKAAAEVHQFVDERR